MLLRCFILHSALPTTINTTVGMLTLPVEVICGGVLPHLSVCDLQALDTAFTNKCLRPHLQQVWKSYLYDCPDQEEMSESQVSWLLGVYVPVSGVFVGTIESDSKITSISTLKRLTIRYGAQTSTLLKLASNCPNLEELYVNNVYGSDTDDAVSALAQNCSQLHTLDISSESLTDIGLSSLGCHDNQLHTLCIEDAEITDAGIQALCDNCPHLKHIGFFSCRNLTDTSLNMIASAYPHLLIAQLYSGKFTDDGLIYFADKCHELRSVSVWSDNNTSRGLTALWAANRNLMDVNISGINFVCDDDVIELAQCCPLLQKLNISHCEQITDAAVIAVAEHCPQLITLDICRCINISDISLIVLGQHCHELKSIDISYLENISDVGIAALAAGCPLLQEFYAIETYITDAGVVALARGCRDLRKTDLKHGMSVGIAAVAAIAENCPLISELLLSSCNIDDACLYVIAQHCRNLTLLDISYSRVSASAAIESVIKCCRSLREFRCQDCLIKDDKTKDELRRFVSRLRVFQV